MLRSQVKTGLQISVATGAAMLLSSAAIAAPANSVLVAQTTSPSGDVIVPTEPGTGGTTIPGSTIPNPPLSGVRFACQNSNSQYTVMYMPESQPNRAYPWAVPSALGGGWSSDRRCNEISRRLESYRSDGLLEMKTAVENGYNTICVTTDRVPSCRIVLTVPNGQDPLTTRDRVFQNLTIADSGQQTQGVLTYGQNGADGNIINQLGSLLGIRGLGRNGATAPPKTLRSSDINLKPFLDRKDGGTGERLNGGVAIRSNAKPRLPKLFRR
ncbi:hypothetical protein C7B65_20955 [Phormidesmis priestleyi ULC007]|uniref:Circadian oscillating protein COP23 n=2 Tax=Phormidesmis priestleyi TaxID=268141 RepID=A0A2T1D8A6_9CYAN|nr:hypothetical protein C7B65_20955 [Phormidesmis priestleyi ULC007]PZO47623.1 MAG: hypothetical protein DCF14_19330 [Phormidesmis priestleyi]